MTKNIWLSISLLILFLSHLQVKAGNGGGYRVSFLGLNQGLPNDFVDDIYQDSEGFLWLSTRDAGLARYDGYSFRYFGVGLSVVQLRSNSCRNVTEDRWHRLWVALMKVRRCSTFIHFCLFSLKGQQTDWTDSCNNYSRKIVIVYRWMAAALSGSLPRCIFIVWVLTERAESMTFRV